MRKLVLSALILSAYPLVGVGQTIEGEWTYIVENGGATITASTAAGAVTIPSVLGGYAVKKVEGEVSVAVFGFPNTSVTSITIPNSVKSIGMHAFYGCTGLTSFTIPNSVTYIGYGAFDYCNSLASIIIPNSVTHIAGYAFFRCTSLASIIIPNSVTYIGYGAFQDCTSLTSITIPDSVTNIEDHAFYGCTSLTSVTIPNSVTSIGGSAFNGCTSLVTVYLPARFADTYTSFGLTASQVTIYYTATQYTANFNAGKDSILNSPNSNGLYTTSQIQNMAVGDLVLTKNVGGTFTLNYDIEQSTDLQTWTPYQALSLPLTGLPTDKAFVRIKMINSSPNSGSATPVGSNL